MKTFSSNISNTSSGLEGRDLTNEIKLLDENRFIALGKEIEKNAKIFNDKYDELDKIASPVVENKYLWGLIKSTNVEKSLEELLKIIQGVAKNTLDAFETNGKNLSSILELMKVSVVIENDLYKQLEDCERSKEDIVNSLNEFLAKYDVNNNDVKSLFEQSFNRTFILRDRIKKLREEILERILECEKKLECFDEAIRESAVNKRVEKLQKNLVLSLWISVMATVIAVISLII